MKNALFEKNRQLFIYEAKELLHAERFSDAVGLAWERLRIYPADGDAYVVLCSALIGQGRIDEAREALTEFGGIIEEMTLVYERVGDVFRGKGYYHDAAQSYEKLLSFRPEAQKAREIIEKMSLLGQEDEPMVQAPIPDVLNAAADPEIKTVTMAQLYVQQGHFHEAVKILEEVLAKDPQNSEAAGLMNHLKAAILAESKKNESSAKKERLIETLSLWLQNIERLKANANANA